MDQIIHNFFNLDILIKVYPMLLKGFWMTLRLCLVVVLLGFAGGLLVAIVYSLHKRWVNVFVIAYVDFFRAFPPLVLLIFVFYGSPFIGLEVPGFVAVLIAFFLNTSSYYGEILRAGIESIGRGQWEAARSTGLSRLQTMFYVILPQAIRNVAPDLTSNTLEVIKFTALASVVALPELLRMGRIAQGITYNPTPLIAVAVIYLVMLWPLVRFLSRLERRMVIRH
ncbi:MAG: amino acid ABC transporter permease [Pseudomonadota bacterium]|nr:amino acid ABC transporter permease [Pseudomonadota bacterium]